MDDTILAVPDAAPLSETRKTLVDSARRRFGSIAVESLVEHVIGVSGDADFSIREAALEAIARRWSFALADGLMVATRPPGGGALGCYTTARSEKGPGGRPGARGKKKRRRRQTESRPYTSLLESLSPLCASCDCPDYIRSSLGVCKHLLVVLDDVFSSPRRVKAAERERAAQIPAGLRLTWDPKLALNGTLDRVTGLRLEEHGHRSGRLKTVSVDPGAGRLANVRAIFSGGRPHPAALGDRMRRRDLLATLDRALTPNGKGTPAVDASPAARALVREETERAERCVRNDQSATETLRHLRSLERKLYSYQREGVERCVRAGRLLLADDMGLGKTTQAIAACHALFKAGRVQRGLIIVPASLKSQWLREWQETTDVPAAVVDGRPEERYQTYRKLKSGFLILNYEQLLRDITAIQALAPEIVVLDEAQRIKNYATKSAAYVKALTPEFRLVLTGTPMENRLEELASILDWVDDVALAPKWRLVPWYTLWQGDGQKSGKAGARHLNTLRTRLEPCLVRRVRREVLSQLPPRTDTRVPIEMTSQQLLEHDELSQPIAQLIRRSKSRPLIQAEFLKLMQLLTQQRIISNGLGQLRFEELWPTYRNARPDPALLEGLFAPKLLEFRRLIDDLVIAQGRKVVVFSQWRRMLRLSEWSVRDVLGDAGVRAVFFTGAEKPSQRTRSIVDFHDESDVRVMFLSDAGGVGLNLQRPASACINLELPWNPAVLEQRIGRIYRLGQTRPIDVYNLVSEPSIEARIAGLISAKQALFSGLFDGTSNDLRFDTAASFLTRVERLVDPGPVPVAPQVSPFEPAVQAATDDLDESFAPSDPALGDAALADDLPPTAEPGSLPAGSARAHEASNVSATPPLEPHATAANGTAALFQALRVERTESGGVRIEAPPEAASSLLALFEGMAKLLGSVAERPRD